MRSNRRTQARDLRVDVAEQALRNSIDSRWPHRWSRAGGAECSPPHHVLDTNGAGRTAGAVDRRSERFDDSQATEARREAELDYRVSPAVGWCGPMAMAGAGRRAAAPKDVNTTDVSVTGRWRRAVLWIGSWRRRRWAPRT